MFVVGWFDDIRKQRFSRSYGFYTIRYIFQYFNFSSMPAPPSRLSGVIPKGTSRVGTCHSFPMLRLPWLTHAINPQVEMHVCFFSPYRAIGIKQCVWKEFKQGALLHMHTCIARKNNAKNNLILFFHLHVTQHLPMQDKIRSWHVSWVWDGCNREREKRWEYSNKVWH